MSGSGESTPEPNALKRTFEKHVTLYIGGVHASDEPILIKTLLGSCVAVCLHDPVARVGGMNHFMLPHGRSNSVDADATRFGVHAMDRLLAAIMKVGGERRRLIAKVFGGAHVLDIQETRDAVPRQNVEFAREFLMVEAFPVHGWDVGGRQAREVHFYPRTGRAFVRRVMSDRVRERLLQREKQDEVRPPQFGEVTFFEEE